MEYKMEEIKIGDNVFFDSTKSQSNHDLYWEVICKMEKEKKLIVKLDEMGFKDLRWTIDITEVRYHEKIKNS